MDELNHCKRDVWTHIQLAPIFLCLYSVYLSGWSFFIKYFPLYFFLINLQYLVSCNKIYLQFLMKIFRNKLFALTPHIILITRRCVGWSVVWSGSYVEWNWLMGWWLMFFVIWRVLLWRLRIWSFKAVCGGMVMSCVETLVSKYERLWKSK